MPIINLPVPEVEQMVTRPVVMAVIEQVKQITNIPQDTEITYVGQNNSRLQFGHNLSPNEAPVKLASDALVLIELEENPDEGMFATTAGNRVENNLDFADTSLGVLMKPIYVGMDLVMTVTFRTPSRTAAVRWRNDARYKASQMREINLHVVDYAYQLPRATLVLLEYIHGLREKQYGYSETFKEYLERHLTTRATQASNVVGNYQELLIRESQDRIQGEFDFRATPRRQERNDGDGWEVEFTYTFSYHKPVMYSMMYPLVVHQQPIDLKYVPQLPATPEERAKRFTVSMGAFHFMEAPVYQQRATKRAPIHYSPEQDGWFPDVLPANKRIIASFFVGVNESKERQLLLNLNNLGGYFLDADVGKWMLEAEYKHLNKIGISPVGISLYRNEALANEQALEVASNGDVFMIGKPDGRKRYRVVITMNEKLSKAHPDSLKRLANYPEAMCKMIKFTNTTTGELYSMLGYLNLNKFSHCATNAGTSLEDAISLITTRKTVMVVGVEAHRESNLLIPKA